MASQPTRQGDRFRRPCSEITRCNGIDYCWCFVFLRWIWGSLAQLVQRNPEPGSVVSSYDMLYRCGETKFRRRPQTSHLGYNLTWTIR
jgi:hypothetical protein